MIPKIIHYCWFGGNPLPKLAKKCIKSWKKRCPDYQIIEWNETNFDIHSNRYAYEAYMNKKWAFVTDYVRLWVIYNYGGIYMDTDVETLKSLDCFLGGKGFTGFEDKKMMVTGIMAGNKGLQLYKKLLEYYSDRSFVKENGSFDTTTNTRIITDIFLQMGFLQNNTYQSIDGFSLYPNDYFCPMDWLTKKLVLTNNTACIHHFSGSWHTKEEKKIIKRRVKRIRVESFKLKVKKIIGLNVYNFIKRTLRRK